MSDLIDTTEMYLRTIYELEEEGIVPLRARIAERLRQSGPTVSQTVARMERAGLLSLSGDRHLQLSEAGRVRAMKVMRKHRLAERLLADVIKLDMELVHDEACRWEHVISDEVEERLVALLGDPTESPWGNPIPGRDGVSEAEDQAIIVDAQSILDLVESKGPSKARIRHMGEHLQAEHEVMAILHDAGVLPGVVVDIELTNGSVRLTTESGEICEIEVEAAHQLFADSLDR